MFATPFVCSRNRADFSLWQFSRLRLGSAQTRLYSASSTVREGFNERDRRHRDRHRSSLLLTRYLSSQLYGVAPTDPLTFIAASVLFDCGGCRIAWLPASRAMKIEPLIALRQE